MLEKRPYNDYYHYLKNRFNAVTYKVSVDGGFTCPNIDGTVAEGGCTYCNNRSFVPKYLNRKDSIRDQIQKGVESQRKRYGAERFLAYFQAYSNTYGELDRLEACYREALEHPDIDGLVLGTRADCLPEPVIALLETLARDFYVAVEVGIESVYDVTLRRINRGHDFAAVTDALERLSGRGIHIGAHLIFGFPGETRNHWLDTARVVSGLPVEYLKLHHLQVIKGTVLAREYYEQPFRVFTFPEWVELVCDFLELLRPDIAIARMSGSAPTHMLIDPQWGRKKHPEVKQQVMNTLRERGTCQGTHYPASQYDTISRGSYSSSPHSLPPPVGR